MEVKSRSLGVFELLVLRPAVPTEKIDTQKLDNSIKQAIGKGVKNVCVDLSYCGSIDFPVVETFKHANRDLLHTAGRLAILCTDVKVTNQLDDLGISNYLRIYQTEEEISADSKEILRQTESYYMGNLKATDTSSLSIDLEAALKKTGLVDDKPVKTEKSKPAKKEPPSDGSILSKNEFEFLLGGNKVDDDDDLMDTVVEKTPTTQEVKIIRKEEVIATEEIKAEPKKEIKSGYRRPGSGQQSQPAEITTPISAPPLEQTKKRTIPLDRFEAEESAIIETRQKKKMSPLVSALIVGIFLIVVFLMAWGLGIIGGKAPDPALLQPTKYKELSTTQETPKQAVPASQPSDVKPKTEETLQEAVVPKPPAPKTVSEVKPEYKAIPKKVVAAKAAPKKTDKEAEELNSEIDDFLKDDIPVKPATPAPAPKVEAVPVSTPPPTTPKEGATGSVFISSSPPTAEILLNGNVIGVANRAPVDLPTGTHSLTLRKDNMEKTVEIQVFEGRNKPLFVKLQ
jgi:hypothetical protein